MAITRPTTKPAAVAPKAPVKPAASAKPAAVPAKPGVPARPNYIKQESFDMPQDDQFQPTIKIVQMISNELIKTDPAYIPGAEAGMMFHSTSKALYDGEEGINLIPLSVHKYYTEWVPRKMGGGFVGQYETKEEMQASADPKNEVTPVVEFTCIMEGSDEMVQVQFNSATKYPIARKWGSLIQEAGTMCGKKYNLKTVARQNKQKQPYYTFDLNDAGWVSEEQYKAADEMAKSMQQALLPAPGEGGEM